MAGNDDADVLGRARASGDFIDFQKPPGTYPVVVVGVSTTVGTKFQSDEEETKLVFDFVPVGHTGNGTFKLWANFSTHSKSNFTAICRALEVPIPANNETVRASTFVGRRAMALIEFVPSTKNPGQALPRITKSSARAPQGNGIDPVTDPDIPF